ncbi:hypothetical protein BN2497_2523 [Janthinobacterium sp. CG23_2]|nr:hypothetical protein BN2497_2523 [Janthinobacterium sp. CG23_2]CUU27659.1 hypothetical protein BN3177_2523 [Janthinobacterium sp. CG23_2]
MPAAIPLAAAVVGGMMASNTAKKQTAAQQEMNNKQIAANAQDPRIGKMLYGEGEDKGLLSQYRDLMNKPQSQAMQDYGNAAGAYLQDAKGDLTTIRNGAYQQMRGQDAPQIGSAPQMGAAMMTNVPMAQAASMSAPGAIENGAYMRRPGDVQGVGVSGPAQNNMDLTKPFEGMINGTPGANPYLTGAIQKGINQSTTAFQNQQADSTRNLTEMIMPSIRGGAIASGQYGGSRQGIAEGRAIGDFGREQQRALSQFGQNNTDAAVSAQAGAYETDSNRALSAMQGLSGQQNTAAIASASNQQSANMANQNAALQTYQTNAQLQQQRDLQQQNNGMQAAQQNGGWQQQANLANQSAILNVGANNQQAQMGANTSNLGSQLTTNGANLNAQMGQNQLNSQNYHNGMAGLGGLLGQAYANAGTQDQYGMNQAIQGNSLLAPYLSKSGTPTQLQPVYNNSGSAALGGAMAGMQFGQGIAGMFNSGSNSTPGAQNVQPSTY